MKKVNDIEWIDIHDDDLCISLGIHPRNAEPRDMSVWTKTNKEKKELKRLRLRHKRDKMFGGVSESAPIPVYDKLILYIKGKPTRSIKCAQSDIPRILSRYTLENGMSAIIKYYWNGKEYKSGTLPFWYW